MLIKELVSAGTRGLKGLGCGLGMSLHIPPLWLHTCSPPPAGGPPEGHVQGSHPPLHVSGPDHLPSGTAGDTCIRQTRMHVTRRLMRGPTPPRTTHRFGPDASLHAKHASSPVSTRQRHRAAACLAQGQAAAHDAAPDDASRHTVGVMDPEPPASARSIERTLRMRCCGIE